MRLSAYAVALCAVVLAALGIQAQDLGLSERFRAEAVERGRAMEFAFELSDVFGGRLTGTPSFRRAGEWARSELEAMGLENVHLEPIPWGRGWSERAFTLRLLEPSSAALAAVAVPFSASTNGLATGEVVLAELPRMGDGDAVYEQFFARHRGTLRGRFILAHRPLAPMPFTSGLLPEEGLARRAPERPPERRGDPLSASQGIQRYRDFLTRQPKVDAFLRDEGVAGVLYQSRTVGGTITPGVGPLTFRTQGVRGRVAGEVLPPPSAVLSWESYNRLARLLDKGRPVRLQMQLAGELHHDPASGFNVLGEIRGVERPDEVVLIGAHLDSWPVGSGASDDAAGVAVVMDAMRILKTLGVRPRRTIRVALWGGHEGAGAPGSRHYIRSHLVENYRVTDLEDANGPWIHRPGFAGLAAYYNLDHGQGPIRGIFLEGNEAVREQFASWFAQLADGKPFYISGGGTTGTDHQFFVEVGLPGFQFVQQPDSLAYTHHSNVDVFDYLKEEHLERNAWIMSYFVYMTAVAPELLPRTNVTNLDDGNTPDRATRTSDVPAAPAVVRVNSAIYDAYVGDYELGPNFILSVTRDGDRLITQATGQQAIEIFPLSETEFFPKAMEARITFVKGPGGKVTHLVLRQKGREIAAAKQK